MKYYVNIPISIFDTFATIAGLIVPARRKIMLWSAVKIRVGRMLDAIGREPLTKSEEFIGTA